MGEFEIAVSTMADNPGRLSRRGGKNGEWDYSDAIEKMLCQETGDYFFKDISELICRTSSCARPGQSTEQPTVHHLLDLLRLTKHLPYPRLQILVVSYK